MSKRLNRANLLPSMTNDQKENLILTSSFGTVAKKLFDEGLLPKTAKVAFIPTASDVYSDTPWIASDREALLNIGYEVFDVALKDDAKDILLDKLSAADIIFVAGGNVTYLAERSQKSGFGQIIRELLAAGKVYVGSSAGSMIAGPSVAPFVTEDLAELPQGFALPDPGCIGLVDYIVLPHYSPDAKHKDEYINQYGSQFKFLKMTDEEFAVESV